MLSVEQVIAFGLAALVIIVIPGPSVVFVIGRALAYGRGIALASVVGNSLGLLTIAAAVAIGLGALVQESQLAFAVVKYAGAAYLIWLGVEAIRRRREFAGTQLGPAARPVMSWSRAARQGYVVGVANPKGYIMFAAVLPQFIDRAQGQVPAQMLLLGLLAFAIGMASDSLWAVLAARLRDWFNSGPTRGAALGAVGGVSMIGLGVGVALAGNPEG